jgi:hypothetical protein
LSFCKTLAPEARKEIAGEIAEEHDISITRACRLMGIHKSYFYYESTKDDSEVEAAIRQKAEATNDGFWKIFRLIRKDGHLNRTTNSIYGKMSSFMKRYCFCTDSLSSSESTILIISSALSTLILLFKT